MSSWEYANRKYILLYTGISFWYFSISGFVSRFQKHFYTEVRLLLQIIHSITSPLDVTSTWTQFCPRPCNIQALGIPQFMLWFTAVEIVGEQFRAAALLSLAKDNNPTVYESYTFTREFHWLVDVCRSSLSNGFRNLISSVCNLHICSLAQYP